MSMPEENQPKTADNDPLLRSVAEQGRTEEEPEEGSAGEAGGEGRGGRA
ncbi:hypothetical protein GCM10010466_37130 [Planomonospora alba]|uniref:Nucleotide exchange factor GrpE n=1 Tax=Planomonospora alba TaxID=161354 RepID=A0ABP6NDQ4_9ACTN